MFISVDLPAPFSPRSACTSRRRRSKFTWSFASTPGKRFVIPRSSRTGGSSAIGDDSRPWPRRRKAKERPEAARGGACRPPPSRLGDGGRDVLDLAGGDLL